MNIAPPRATDAGVFLWLTYHAMRRRGLDTATIFASIGLPDRPPARDRRRDNAYQQPFWAAAERVSGDADIGLRLGHTLAPARGHILEYLMLSSADFGHGLERALRYQALLTDALELRLSVDGDRARLDGFSHPVRHYVAFTIGATLGFLRQVSDDTFQPLQVDLAHAGHATPSVYERIYGCPVRPGCAEGAIHFDADLLRRVSPAAEPELARAHERLAARQWQALQRERLISRMEDEVESLMAWGDTDLNALATRLDTPVRRLRRALQQARTSHTAILARVRLRVAKRLLARTDLPVALIMQRTGFSEPAAFCRAFKRWTGDTPSAYRQRKQTPPRQSPPA